MDLTQRAEIHRDDELQEARAMLAAMEERLQAAHAETIGVRAMLHAAMDRNRREAADRDAVLERAVAAESALARLTEQLAVLTAQAALPALKRAEAAERKIDVLLTTRALQEARVQTLRSACVAVVDSVMARETEDAGLRALARWMAAKRPLIGLLRRPGGQRIAALRSAAEAQGVGELITEQACAAMLRRRMLLGLLRRPTASAEALVSRMLIQHAGRTRHAVAEQLAAAVLDAKLGRSPDAANF